MTLVSAIFSNKDFSTANSKSLADSNIRQFTCKCSGICSSNKESEPNESSQLYEDLPSGDAFRVIEILQGLYDDPVVCRLHIALISEATLSYAALFYTWKFHDNTPLRRTDGEDPPPKIPISCNGSEVLIGEKLFQAIKRIRQPSRSQMLWENLIRFYGVEWLVRCLDERCTELCDNARLFSYYMYDVHYILLKVCEVSRKKKRLERELSAELEGGNHARIKIEGCDLKAEIVFECYSHSELAKPVPVRFRPVVAETGHEHY
ncbi:hypothetical protein GGR58DRAFT_452691 [Xylaria digitata]|nr:hypothetical protein GGR58DRAFT_452691 [Xylaria digitata]